MQYLSMHKHGSDFLLNKQWQNWNLKHSTQWKKKIFCYTYSYLLFVFVFSCIKLLSFGPYPAFIKFFQSSTYFSLSLFVYLSCSFSLCLQYLSISLSLSLFPSNCISGIYAYLSINYPRSENFNLCIALCILPILTHVVISSSLLSYSDKVKSTW